MLSIYTTVVQCCLWMYFFPHFKLSLKSLRLTVCPLYIHFISTLCPLSLISGLYGHHLNVMDWTTHELIKRIDLGPDGRLPLEIRFLHDPTATEGYVGCALSSTVFRFFRAPVSVPAAFVASILNTRES